MLPCIQACIAQKYDSVVPDGAVTGTLMDVPGGSHNVSSRPSRPDPSATLTNWALVGSVTWGPTVVNTSSHNVPGAPQPNTSSMVAGSSLALTIVRVCGSSVSSTWLSVSWSPLLSVVRPGLNRRFEKILELMWTSSVPIVRIVPSCAALLATNTNTLAMATAETATVRATREVANAWISPGMSSPSSR